MKVPHSKEAANHAVPESCVLHREVHGEALTGVHIGQPWSSEINLSRVPTLYPQRKATRLCALSRAHWPTWRGHRTWHVCTLFAREPGGLGFDQTPQGAGPHREGEEP